MQKVQPGRGLTPHSQLHRQARLEGAPHPPTYRPLGKHILLSLVGTQVPPHSSPGEALAADTLHRRNSFREVELFPHPPPSKPQAQTSFCPTPNTVQSNLKMDLPVEGARGTTGSCVQRKSPPDGDGVWAVPQAGCGWQGHCRRDGAPSDPGSQEPFIA